jgi:hypothetical protein
LDKNEGTDNHKNNHWNYNLKYNNCRIFIYWHLKMIILPILKIENFAFSLILLYFGLTEQFLEINYCLIHEWLF